jgi:hypothetical protein
LYFDIESENIHGSNFAEKWPGVIAPIIEWKLIK